MMLVLLVYIGGVLSILSPCILPLIPFVFARGDQPFVRSGLPLLLGMALTVAGVASLAAVAGGWAVNASQFGRYVPLVVLALFALTLMSDRLLRASVTCSSCGKGGKYPDRNAQYIKA
jgi:cytochrome c biogenesis protein CcdA